MSDNEDSGCAFAAGYIAGMVFLFLAVAACHPHSFLTTHNQREVSPEATLGIDDVDCSRQVWYWRETEWNRPTIVIECEDWSDQ